MFPAVVQGLCARRIFYVNTFNLKAQPLWGMETLALHEASPGHHFQGAITQEITTLPKFRRFATGYVAYSEGWALYAESIGRLRREAEQRMGTRFDVKAFHRQVLASGPLPMKVLAAKLGEWIGQ